MPFISRLSVGCSKRIKREASSIDWAVTFLSLFTGVTYSFVGLTPGKSGDRSTFSGRRCNRPRHSALPKCRIPELPFEVAA